MTTSQLTAAAITELESIAKRINLLLDMLYASQEQDVPVVRKGKRVSFKERLTEGRVK